MKLTGQILEGVLYRSEGNYTRVIFVTKDGRTELANGPKKAPRLTFFWRTVSPKLVRGRRIQRFLVASDDEWVCELDGEVFLEWRLDVLQHGPNLITGRSLSVLRRSELDDETFAALLDEKQVVPW